jgi:formylglycine-generating enzyme required for sulfatase activity
LAQEDREYGRTEIGLTEAMKKYLPTNRRVRQVLNAALAAMVLLVLGTSWLWQKGYTIDQAALKLQSFFVSILVPPQMVQIAAGSFQMGDVEKLGESWRNPVHPVTIKPFKLGKYEVTFDEYDRFAIATGRHLPEDQGWGRGSHPVMNVSWEDAKAYAAWLSAQTGTRYRLPTESEWEYAARSGDKEEQWAGTSEESQVGAYAIFTDNSGSRTAEIGTKLQNSFGLHDLSGNVWEWVEDCAHSAYDGAPEDGTAWLEAHGGHCGARVLRGGSWYLTPGFLRTSIRIWLYASHRGLNVGFRLAQDMQP